MIRSELVEQLLQANPGLTRRQAERIVACVFVTIADQLAAGGRVELRGFGVFYASARSARAGRNPRNGAGVAVPAKRVPRFKLGKRLLQRLNPEKAPARRLPRRSGRSRTSGSGAAAASWPI